tara:strand:+ start:87 stop:470 length:384 start_codon:yes stop_codon:yes gene_type:complete
MNVILRLLEIIIQASIVLAFTYCILSYWGFDSKHFLMLTEGRLPKRVQLYLPPKNHPAIIDESSSNPQTSESEVSKTQQSVTKSYTTTESATKSETTTELAIKSETNTESAINYKATTPLTEVIDSK